MPINLNIQLREDLDSSVISADGFEVYPLNDEMAKVFGIPRQLVSGDYVESKHGPLWGDINNWWGRFPNEFVTSDPVVGSGAYKVPDTWTPYADSWGEENQVMVQRKAVGAHLIESRGSVDAIATNKVRNYSDTVQPGQEVTLDYTEEVQDSRENEKHWSIALENTIEVTVGGEYAGFSAEATRSISLTVEGGGSTTKTHTVTKGRAVSLKASVTAEPHSIYPVSVQAGRGSLRVQIVYEYTLMGQWRAIYFKPYEYQGRKQLTSPPADVNELLESLDLPTKIVDMDTLDVGFVTSGDISVGEPMPIE